MAILTEYPNEINFLLTMDPTTFQFLSDVDPNYHTYIYDAFGRTTKLFLAARTNELREIDSLKSRIRGYEADLDGTTEAFNRAQKDYLTTHNKNVDLTLQLEDERRRAGLVLADILKAMREVAPAAYDQTISALLLR